MADVNLNRVGGARPVTTGYEAGASTPAPRPKSPDLEQYFRITGQGAPNGKSSWVQIFASADRPAAVDWVVGQMQETV